MAGKVTREKTWAYADALATRGERITTTAVRQMYGEEFGERDGNGGVRPFGNPTDISNHLKDRRAARHSQPQSQRAADDVTAGGEPMPPEIQTIVATLNALWGRVQQRMAQAAEEARRQARVSAKAMCDTALAGKQADIDALEAERADLADAVTQEVEAREVLARDVADLRRQLAIMTGERDQALCDLEARSGELAVTTTTLRTAEARIQALKKAEMSLRADTAEKDGALRELRAQLKAAESKAVDADAREARALTRVDAADTHARDAQKAVEQARIAADARVAAAEETARHALTKATAALEHADQRIRRVEEEAQKVKAMAERRIADAEASAAAVRGNGPATGGSLSAP